MVSLDKNGGVQNGPPYPLNSESNHNPIYDKSLNDLIKSPNRNLDKWGTDSKHNVLYITGYSGSGKSTAALALKNKHKNVSIIHLDHYTDSKQVPGNKDFEKYMDGHLKDWKKLYRNKDFNSKQYWNLVDSFVSTLEKYGSDSFRRNQRVIVEGVQIMDDWWGDQKYLQDKPVALMKTNSIVSEYRASKRDENNMRPFIAIKRIFDKSLNTKSFRDKVGI